MTPPMEIVLEPDTEDLTDPIEITRHKLSHAIRLAGRRIQGVRRVGERGVVADHAREHQLPRRPVSSADGDLVLRVPINWPETGAT